MVASLNPILTDMIRQVGGSDITIIELLKPGGNPHTFRPSPSDMEALHNTSLIFASGKGMEIYLDDLYDLITPEQTIIDVGGAIPSIHHHSECRVEDGHAHHHGEGSVDPHWWHSIENGKRAARRIAHELKKADPTHAGNYDKRYQAYRDRLDNIQRWAKQQISTIPRADRKLATAHAAFAYFCNDYGFEQLSVLGVTTEEQPNPQHLANVITELKHKQVKAIFPETASNPKVLESMVRETGIRTGGYLLAGSPDPDNPSYEAMIKHNITIIVEALAPKRDTD